MQILAFAADAIGPLHLSDALKLLCYCTKWNNEYNPLSCIYAMHFDYLGGGHSIDRPSRCVSAHAPGPISLRTQYTPFLNHVPRFILARTAPTS
jgi:hypothetical protein